MDVRLDAALVTKWVLADWLLQGWEGWWRG